jgi:hypothetical protein
MKRSDKFYKIPYPRPKLDYKFILTHLYSNIGSFLGLAGYYRRFIEGFSKISKPMTELLGKDKKFDWIARCESSFLELKQ